MRELTELQAGEVPEHLHAPVPSCPAAPVVGIRTARDLALVGRADARALDVFASGIKRARYGVIVGLPQPWNPDAVQGHAKGINMPKRQMFSRGASR